MSETLRRCDRGPSRIALVLRLGLQRDVASKERMSRRQMHGTLVREGQSSLEYDSELEDYLAPVGNGDHM